MTEGKTYDPDIIGAWLARPMPPPTPIAVLLRRAA